MDESKQEDYSVTQVARVIGVSGSTIRSWTNRFSNHTSKLARPDEGKERRYNPDDIALFNSVKVMRDLGEPMARIMPRIDAGERLEPVDKPLEPPPPRQRGDKSLITEEHQKLIRDFSKISGAHEIVTSERDYLRDELASKDDKISELTERAIKAETELKILKETPDQAPAAPQSDEPESRRPWWRFWG